MSDVKRYRADSDRRDRHHLCPRAFAPADWLFFTGHEATDYEIAIAPPVAANPACRWAGAPRYRSEGDFLRTPSK